jgi:rubrerythrin
MPDPFHAADEERHVGTPDETGEYSATRLRQWSEALKRDGADILGDSLYEYANAWQGQVTELATVKRTRDELLSDYETFQLDVRAALGCLDDGTPFVEHITRIREELAAIKRDIPKLHQRLCWKCQIVHWHASDHGKPVDCPVCGSRDTRRLRSLSPLPEDKK